MNRHPYHGRRWPDARQVLLLKAAVSDRVAALAAWHDWRRAGDLDDVDRASYEVLPTLFRNFERLGIDDPDMGRLKGIYRRTWYQNQVLVRHAAQAIRQLGDAGIAVMVLKGVALMELYYHDHGIRPMNDVDVLVPTKEARRAIDVLRRNGWKPYPRPDRSLEPALSVLHGAPLTNGAGGIDLHWHALEESCQDDADDDFWEASRPITVNGTPARAQCPADLLLHVCVHGSRGQPERVIRWVPDALAILRDAAEPVDWERLVDQAVKRRLTLGLGTSLRFLRDTFDAPTPADVLRSLERAPTSWLERTDYRAQGSSPTVYWAIVRDTSRYLRLSGGRSSWRRVTGFSRYLACLWELDRARQVPAEGLRRVSRRLWETRLRVWRPLAPR